MFVAVKTAPCGVFACKRGQYGKAMEVSNVCKAEGYLLRIKDGRNCEILNYQMLYKLVFMFSVQLLSQLQIVVSSHDCFLIVKDLRIKH